MSKYYDKVYKRQLADNPTVEFVGEKNVTLDVRNGEVVEPYKTIDVDKVTVRLPAVSRVKTWPDTEATVNWSAMGARKPQLAIEYARLIIRAAKFAMKAQAEFDAAQAKAIEDQEAEQGTYERAHGDAPKMHRAFGIAKPAPVIEEVPTPAVLAWLAKEKRGKA